VVSGQLFNRLWCCCPLSMWFKGIIDWLKALGLDDSRIQRDLVGLYL